MKKTSYDGKVVKDELGRSITLRAPTLMDKVNLQIALKKHADIASVVGMFSMVIHVAKIDDYVFETPLSYLECEDLMRKLANEGFDAVIKEVFSEDQEEEVKDKIKK